MKKIGKLKTYTSKEIKDSYVSIGFECLDRDLFNADKCYDPLAKTGVKYARCQTGWAKTEKEKGVYDFAWLDNVVDNLLARGVDTDFLYKLGLEYRLNVRYLQGEINLETYYDELYHQTMQFIKRQRTWYRKENPALTHYLTEPTTYDSIASSLIKNFLHVDNHT